MKKVVNIISSVLVILGFMLLIGTVGGVEWDTLTIGQGIKQSLVGIGIMVLGGYLFNSTYDPNEYEEEENDDE